MVLLSAFMLVYACGCGEGGQKPEVTSTTRLGLVKEDVKVTTTVQTTAVTATAATVASVVTSGTYVSSSVVQPTSTIVGECASDLDCPSGFNSSKYCWKIGDYWNGDDSKVYMDEVKYVCSAGGTPLARCAEVRGRIPVDRCISSKCFNGDCYPTQCFNQRVDENEEQIDCGGVCPDCSLGEKIECYSDCDCLSRESQLAGRYYRSCQLNQLSASELTAYGKCRDYTIYQNLMSYKCMKPGSVNSYCVGNTTQQLITASCRDKNCTLDCRFKTSAYPNLAVINKINVSFTPAE